MVEQFHYEKDESKEKRVVDLIFQKKAYPDWDRGTQLFLGEAVLASLLSQKSDQIISHAFVSKVIVMVLPKLLNELKIKKPGVLEKFLRPFKQKAKVFANAEIITSFFTRLVQELAVAVECYYSQQLAEMVHSFNEATPLLNSEMQRVQLLVEQRVDSPVKNQLVLEQLHPKSGETIFSQLRQLASQLLENQAVQSTTLLVQLTPSAELLLSDQLRAGVISDGSGLMKQSVEGNKAAGYVVEIDLTDSLNSGAVNISNLVVLKNLDPTAMRMQLNTLRIVSVHSQTRKQEDFSHSASLYISVDGQLKLSLGTLSKPRSGSLDCEVRSLVLTTFEKSVTQQNLADATVSTDVSYF